MQDKGKFHVCLKSNIREPKFLHMMPRDGTFDSMCFQKNNLYPFAILQCCIQQSPAQEQILFQELIVSPSCSQFQQSLPRYPAQATGYIVLTYYNRFIMLFTHIIHKKQTQEMKKTLLILQYNTVKLQEYSMTAGINRPASSNWREELLTEGGRGGGRWQV